MATTGLKSLIRVLILHRIYKISAIQVTAHVLVHRSEPVTQRDFRLAGVATG